MEDVNLELSANPWQVVSSLGLKLQQTGNEILKSVTKTKPRRWN